MGSLPIACSPTLTVTERSRECQVIVLKDSYSANGNLNWQRLTPQHKCTSERTTFNMFLTLEDTYSPQLVVIVVFPYKNKEKSAVVVKLKSCSYEATTLNGHPRLRPVTPRKHSSTMKKDFEWIVTVGLCIRVISWFSSNDAFWKCSIIIIDTPSRNRMGRKYSATVSEP